MSASFAAGQSRGADDQILGVLAEAAGEAGVDGAHAESGRPHGRCYYVLGFTADEQSRLQWDAAGALPEGQSILTADPSAGFAFGLRLLIDGLAAQRMSDAEAR